MKIHSGLIGISNNANARQGFFHASQQSLKGNLMSLLINHKNTMRYNQVLSTRSKLPYWVTGIPLIQKVVSFTTSWHMHMFPKRVSHRYLMSTTVDKLYEDYVAERINGDVSLWAPVKKQNNAMFLSGSKKQEAIGGSERNKITLWSVYSSSQIEPGHRSEECSRKLQIYSDSQGTVCPRWVHSSKYTDKSKLIHYLEKLGEKQWNSWECTSTSIRGTCWWSINIFSTL